MSYCPFEIDTDLRVLGAEVHSLSSKFGPLRTYHLPQNNSNTATLFIHGVAADSTTWSPLLKAARQQNLSLGNIILVDLPGFGHSQNTRNEMPIHEIGDELLKITFKLGYEKVQLVGHSMGGFLSLDMAARTSDNAASSRIIAVSVFAGSYFAILNTIKRPVYNSLINFKTATLWNLYALFCRTGQFGEYITKILAKIGLAKLAISPFVAKNRQMKHQVATTIVNQLNSRGVLQTAANGPAYDAVRLWSQIAVPLIAVFGSKDSLVTSWDEKELLCHNPKATTGWIQDAGHLMILEKPFECLHWLPK